MPTSSLKLRSLKLRLQRLIDERYPQGVTRQEIGKNLGLASDRTVLRYLRGEGLKFERQVLEKACDWLAVDIGQLLELVPCNFFPPGNKLLRLASKQEGREDREALTQLDRLFSNVDDESLVSQDPDELARNIYARNCVIVGSPHHNSAGEIALCTLFSATPGDASEENRRRLPLTIEAPAIWQVSNALVKNIVESGRGPLECHALVPGSGEKSQDDRTFEKKSSWATADLYTPDAFRQASFKKARDFGIILVADHWVGSDRKAPVRTYWLSGFSSVGTLASLLAVMDNVRIFSLDADKEKPGEFVLGIVKATFQKDSGSVDRDLNDYEIVDTIRGSLPHPVQVPTDREKNKPPNLRVPPQRDTSSFSIRTRQPSTKRNSS